MATCKNCDCEFNNIYIKDYTDAKDKDICLICKIKELKEND